MNVGVMSQLTFGAWKHETTAHFCTLVGFSNWAPSITISLMGSNAENIAYNLIPLQPVLER